MGGPSQGLGKKKNRHPGKQTAAETGWTAGMPSGNPGLGVQSLNNIPQQVGL